LSFFNKKIKASGRVGVAVSDQCVAIARVTRTKDAANLDQCVKIPVESAKEGGDALKTKISEWELEGMPCSYVLSPRDYNIHLIEAPSVEAAEMKSAVRWKIKDLLDMNVEQAAIDIFPVPEDANKGRTNMLYVVATLKSKIVQIVDLITASGLQLEVIDIPELAMKNLTTEFMNDEHGLAFMDLRKTGSTMNLSKNGSLYLTRRINTQMDSDVMESEDWDSLKEKLVLEIQRSLDYYESQMGQSQISQLIIAPRESDTQQMVETLDAAMGVSVSALDLPSNLENSEQYAPELYQSCMSVIGAALRSKGVPA